MQVRPGVVPRPHHVVDAQLLDVNRVTGRIYLPALLEILAVPNRHGVVAIRKRVIVIRCIPVVLDLIGRGGPEERLGHAGAGITLRDLTVTSGTYLGVHEGAGLRGQTD